MRTFFEYIKRDIIVQFYEKKLLEKIDLNALFGSEFTFDDLTSVVSFLLSCVPTGEFYNNVFKKFLEKKEEYEEKKHTVDKYCRSLPMLQGVFMKKMDILN